MKYYMEKTASGDFAAVVERVIANALRLRRVRLGDGA